MAIFPFLFIRDEKLKSDEVLINHERIHFKQQLELFILPFYLFYLLHYLFNLIVYKNHSLAYFNICFEREAYTNDRNLRYLVDRKRFSWWYYFGKQK